MRHFASAARVYLFSCVLAASVISTVACADELTVDLLAPATACNGSKCPSDISLPELGSTIPGSQAKYEAGLTSFTVATASRPLVCDEVRGTTAPYQYGPTSGADQFTPIYSNALSGSLLDFDAGGASIVDGSFSFNGVYSVSRANTTQSQVACYAINNLGDNTPALANSSASGDRVFYDQFDAGHRSDEPWVSINTVNAPTSPAHVLGYVLQIHNASQATNWHLSFGYEHQFFNKTLNGGFAGQWYVLNSSNPQPGPIVSLSGAVNGTVEAPYTLAASDIQSATNSVYLYVTFNSSATAVSSWAGLASTFYAATASVFAPTGTYAQRIDDKSAVAGNVNVPTQNIGSIVCSNDPAASSCTILDQDGSPATFKYTNTVTSGSATIDPIAYVVDPSANTTLPSTTAALAVSNVTCDDPQGIFATPVTASNFAASPSASGAQKLQFSFNPSAGLFVPGTATCTATFSSGGLSSTQSFTVTMQQLTTTHFLVAADDTATAGSPLNFTVTAKDGAGNTVSSYGGTVQFSANTDPNAILPPSTTLTNGVGTFQATLTKSGAQKITATDGSITGFDTVQVAAGAATHFSVAMQSGAGVGGATSATVTALDANGNEATSYAGTVHYTSTDASADLPSDGQLGTTQHSHGFPSITFHSAGDWTVTATDTVDNTITGTSNSVHVE